MPAKLPTPPQRYIRNRALAQYIGVSEMTLRRWKEDPDLETPAPMVVNEIQYNDLPAWDEWLHKRAVDLSTQTKHRKTASV